MKRRRSLILLAILTLLLALPARPSTAQEGARCFAETGFCISGRIREFWERNGGLLAFGFPITEQREELNRENGVPYQTQWFERVRLELHPETARPYDVLLGRLGDDRLRQTGRDWQGFPREAPQPGCQFFAQTGFNVCGNILRAWRANGLEFDGQNGSSADESLALYGAPISAVLTETIEGHSYQSQWFERARFELHPENAPPYDVLLGRLAAETRDVALAAPGPWLLFIGSNAQLYRANSDGTGQTRLPFTDQLRTGAQSTVEVNLFSVAPDGQHIAALVTAQPSPDGAATTSLVLTNRNGNDIHVLAKDLAVPYAYPPAWSPDSRQIAFVQPVDGRTHILSVINADGSGRRQLTAGTTSDIAPQWSPDGNTIAFMSAPTTSGRYELTVVSSQGGQPRGIASPPLAGLRGFQWAPGGNELVFTTVENERQQIVALNPSTGAQRTIVREDVDVVDAALSPDGSRIAYYRCCSSYNSQLVVRDLRSGQVTQIGYGAGLPRWSPDGQYIAVVENQRVRWPNVIHRSDGGDTRRVEIPSTIIDWLP